MFDYLRLPLGICQATDANSFQRCVCYVMIRHALICCTLVENFASAFAHQGAVPN